MTDDPKPPKPDPKGETPEEIFANAPFEQKVEALAIALGKHEGLEGEELRKYLSVVTTQVQSVVQHVQLQDTDIEQRKVAAAQLETMLDQISKSNTKLGNAVASGREPIAATFRGVDLQQLSKGMRVFSDWLSNPTAKGEAEVRQLVESLERTMGPPVGYDPVAEEEQRREELRKDVRKSLDKIFRGDKKPPT